MNDDIIFNRGKFKEMIHYMLSKGDFKCFGKAVLYNLAYFSDFNHYEIYERPITGERYFRRPAGPVSPSFDGQIRQELINEGKIEEIPQIVHNRLRYGYVSLKSPDLELLCDGEIEVIDDVMDNLSQMDAQEIMDYSRGDLPWRIAKNEEELEYEYVFYREPEYSVREYADDEN